ncbi:MAG TPA: hypothetical protein DEP84_09895, partial [Chloroflexi bacterium]|nr:hypothetical protein [Chloroflexota bacterium]
PPLPLATPQATRQVEGWDGGTRWISATVSLRQQGGDTRLDFQFQETTGGVTVEFYKDSCPAESTNLAYQLDNVASGDSRTLSGQNLLRLVDGGHAMVLRTGSRSTCTSLGDLPNGPYSDKMIDTEKLQSYGISVRDADKNGNVVAYVPLNVVKDETGGGKAAFAARMLYWPAPSRGGGEGWGNAHEVRVVWLVQMLDDEGNTNMVHVYPEEWTLTGLSVREDHGMEIAVAFEDPAQESGDALKSDDRLWKLADGLQKTFTSPRDQNGNNIRDIGIVTTREGKPIADSTIKARFDNQSNGSIPDGDARLWGIPRNALRVLTYAYDHQDYLAKIPSEITPDILNTYFTSGGQPRTDAPTLLFAREEHYRSAGLDMTDGVIAVSGSRVTVNMAADKVSLDTLASLSWGPYRHRNGAWEAYPLDEYWDKMAVRFKEIFQANPPRDERGNAITDPIALEGLVGAAQAYYIALTQGSNRVVPSDYVGLITAKVSGYVADADLAQATVNSTGAGLELVASLVAEDFFDMLQKQHEEVSEMFGNLFQQDKRGKLKILGDLLKGKVTEFRNLRTNALSTAGTGLAVAALGLSIGASFSKDETVKHITLGVAVAATAYDFANTIKGIASATKGVSGFANKMAAIGKQIHGAAMKAGIVLTVIAIGVTIGLFVAQWAMGAFSSFGSLKFNAALAATIATIIATVIMFAISLIPIVGQIIAAVIAVVDAVINLICALTDSKSDICKGISGYLAEAIAWTIYSQTALVSNMGDPDRTKTWDFKPALVDAGQGFAEGNQVRYSMKVENAITLGEPDNWKGYVYWWQYDYGNLALATFRYALQAEEQDLKGIELGQMQGAWQRINRYFKGKDALVAVQGVSGAAPLRETGINRPVNLYLTEAYAVPTQECWIIPVPPYAACSIKTDDNDGKSNHTDLGKGLYWDVFPATLDGFYQGVAKDGGFSLAWGQDDWPTFPRMKDFDGDGLLGKADGGNDPNDGRWDSDGDGLADPFELEQGSDPQLVDTDGDGLSDYEEAVLGTNPNRQDSDGDGLPDKQELDGWELVYDFAADGTPLTTWVTSDPLSVDADGDGLTDFQEKTYGFHPQVINDPNVLSYESQVRETGAPVLLLRFEENAGATTFSNVSGEINNGACASPLGGGCPAAGHTGRYGNALVFDGADDVVTVKQSASLNLANTSFTVAFWAKRNAAGRWDMAIGQGTDSNNQGLHIGFRDNNTFTCDFYGNGLDTAAAYTDSDWHHWACTYDAGSRRQIIYRDGANVAQRTASAHYQGAGDVWVGKAPWGAHFSGRLDEVAVFAKALSQAEVQASMEARYNPNDLIVKPGDTLSYTGTVQNNLWTRYARGLLTTDFPGGLESAVPPATFILPPGSERTMSGDVTVRSDATSGRANLTQVAGAIVVDPADTSRPAASDAALHLRFDDPPGAGLTGGFANAADPTGKTAGSCSASPPDAGGVGGGSCPTSGVPGRDNQAVLFDGIDDYVQVPHDSAFDFGRYTDFSVSLWVKTAGWSGDPVLVSNKDWTSGKNKGFALAAASDGTWQVNVGDGSNRVDLQAGTIINDNQWHHLAATFDRDGHAELYQDGNSVAFLFSIGNIGDINTTYPIAIGQDGTLKYPHKFAGLIDDVRIYPRAFSWIEVRYDLYRAAPRVSMHFDEAADEIRLYEVGAYGPPGPTYDVAVAGNYAYVAAQWAGLRVVDVSNPASPREVGASDNPGDAWDVAVAVAGNYAYVVHYVYETNMIRDSGLRVVDVSNPASPREVGIVDTPGQSHDVAVAGSYAYVADGESGLRVVDVSNPTSPREVGAVDTPGYAQGVAVAGNYAYVADGNSGLRVVDVSNPASPREVGAVDTPGTAWGVAVAGSYAYVADWWYGVRVVDISNPANPWEVGVYWAPGTAEGVAVAGNYAYVANWDKGLRVVDVSDPASPREVTASDTAGYNETARGVAVAGSYIYLAQENDGLRILSLAAGNCSLGGINPQAGVKGMMGLAAQFDGQDDYVTLGKADSLGLFSNSFTVMAWIRGDQFASGDHAILGTDKRSNNQGLHLVVRDGKPYMGFYGNDTAGTTELSPNIWYHLTWRYDIDKQEQAIFVNGYLDKAVGNRSWFVGADQTVHIGRALGGSYFNGRIDELAIYNRALSDDEIRDIFLYQGKWIEERQTHEITIDAEAPTSSLRSYNPAGANYRPNRDAVLDIQATDATSYVALAELGVKKDGQSGFTWTAAPECQDTSPLPGGNEGGAWCPTFDPVQFGGEGTYTLQTRATDAVGHRETPGTSYTLSVDGTPPAAAFTRPVSPLQEGGTEGGVLLSPQPHPTVANAWLLPLSGTVSDPNLNSGVTGSGVAADSIKVTLLDASGNPAGAGPQRASATSDQWSVEYVFYEANPTGVYTLTVEAADIVGNTATTSLGTIQVDATPPITSLDLSGVPTTTVTSTLTLRGQVTDTQTTGVAGVEVAFTPLSTNYPSYNEIPPAGQVLHLPLDDTPDQDGNLSFQDLSGSKYDGTCSGDACPTAGAPGHIEGAAQFDGVDDY